MPGPTQLGEGMDTWSQVETVWHRLRLASSDDIGSANDDCATHGGFVQNVVRVVWYVEGVEEEKSALEAPDERAMEEEMVQETEKNDVHRQKNEREESQEEME